MTAVALAERLRGLHGDAEALWRACEPVLRGADWQQRKLAVNALVRADVPTELASHLLDAVQDQDNAGLRNGALEVLQLLGPQLVPAIIDRLDGADAETRKFLIDVLGQVGSPVAAPRLAALLSASDGNVRFAAAEALGRLATPQAADALFKHLRTTREATEQFVVLQSLTHCAQQHALRDPPLSLVEHLRADPLLTRPLLGLIHALESVEGDRFLWDWLGEFDAMRLQEAAKFLGGIDPERLLQRTRRLGRPRIHAARDDVRGLLQAYDPVVRAGAVWLAVWSGHGDTLVEPLRADRLDLGHFLQAAQLARADEVAPLLSHIDAYDVDRARALVQLAATLGDVTFAPALRVAAGRYPELRAHVFRCCAELGDATVLDWLPQLLKHGDDIEDVVAGLQPLLASEQRRITAMLAPWSESISASDEWRTFLVLVERLNLVELRNRVELAWKRAEPAVRAAALNVLARFRLEFARRYLALSLHDEAEDVRLAACEILYDVADANSEREVRLLMRDRTPWIRAEGLRTWLKLKGEDAVPDLLAALQDGAEIVQIEAVRALRSLQRAELADRLAALLQRGTPEVVAEVLRFYQTTNVAPKDADRRFLDAPSWRVRAEAALWLGQDPELRQAVRERLNREDDPDVLALALKVVGA